MDGFCYKFEGYEAKKNRKNFVMAFENSKDPGGKDFTTGSSSSISNVTV